MMKNFYTFQVTGWVMVEDHNAHEAEKQAFEALRNSVVYNFRLTPVDADGAAGNDQAVKIPPVLSEMGKGNNGH